MIAQRQVHDAALARRHGRKFVGRARLADSLRGHVGGQPKFFQPHGALIHAIEADLSRVRCRAGEASRGPAIRWRAAIRRLVPAAEGNRARQSSTRISGLSQSRSSVSGGSTVMRYFRRKPPWVTTPRRSSLIFFAAAILSGMDIGKLLAPSSWPSAQSVRTRSS